jgi:hypothetical protein
VTTQNQQLIFDNGMSYAMVPEKEFIKIAETLAIKFGVICVEHEPLWMCQCNKAQYDKLPSIKFTALANGKGETHVLEMPKQAYMKTDPKMPGVGFLLMTPW